MMQTPPTDHPYLNDDYCFENTGMVVPDQTCFPLGGGGQPPDEGTMNLPNGETMGVISIQSDNESDVLWHVCSKLSNANGIDKQVHLFLNKARRPAIMRYQTALHVLNTSGYRQNYHFSYGQYGKEQQALLCAHHPGMTLHEDQLLQES